MTSPPTHATVLNTTVLSNFAQVDHVELLVALPRVVTVEAVEEELSTGAETHSYIDHALAVLGDEIPVISPASSATQIEAELLESLDPGEAQALAVAAVGDGLVVTDDGDARTAAKQRGIDLTGSIGVLVRSVDNDRLSVSTADSYLKRWIDDGGFRSPARDFERFLDR